MKRENYLGRLLTQDQLPEELREQAMVLPAMREEKGKLLCNRCGSLIDKENWQLQTKAYYCRECLILGRIKSDEKLYTLPQEDFKGEDFLIWQGQLTPFQEEVAKGLLTSLTQGQHTLVHAVTGAGKTEMIYPLVAQALKEGKAVCLASPRIDVCLELHKRMEKDFSCPIALLHGQSEPYFRSPLVIATTHQLLKFYHAFDLIIIDEVDAFPYVDNPMLYQAVENALKKTGTKIFLTATSTDALDKQVKSGKLKRLSLPRRFHGNPLILPQPIWLSGYQKNLSKHKLPKKLLNCLKNQRKTGFPLLLFVPNIERGQMLAQILQTYFPQEKVGFVASTTENRLEIVESFRKHALTILVTTTILERGVTFPCVDVFVLESNHRLFTKSALVQIAGRVGRSKERPEGLLYFFQDGLNRSILAAIREIRTMNKEAGF